MRIQHAFRSAACAAAVLALAAPGIGLAQQKQKVTYKVAAQDSRYPQRHVIQVGDEPGHELTLYEIHRKFNDDGPVVNGVRIKEMFTRGTGDYVNSNGLSTNYAVYVGENGDRFYSFGRTMGHAESGKRTTVSVAEIRGGTGKFAGIKGLVRGRGASDGKAGTNETNSELEYWFEK